MPSKSTSAGKNAYIGEPNNGGKRPNFAPSFVPRLPSQDKPNKTDLHFPMIRIPRKHCRVSGLPRRSKMAGA